MLGYLLAFAGCCFVVVVVVCLFSFDSYVDFLLLLRVCFSAFVVVVVWCVWCCCFCVCFFGVFCCCFGVFFAVPFSVCFRLDFCFILLLFGVCGGVFLCGFFLVYVCVVLLLLLLFLGGVAVPFSVVCFRLDFCFILLFVFHSSDNAEWYQAVHSLFELLVLHRNSYNIYIYIHLVSYYRATTKKRTTPHPGALLTTHPDLHVGLQSNTPF